MSGKLKKVGVDDFFAMGGTVAQLEAHITSTPPDTTPPPDQFIDERIADIVADDALADRFVRCQGLGWMQWTGQRWRPATDETVTDAICAYINERWTEARESGQKAAERGWHSFLTAPKVKAVLWLARTKVECQADEFDAHPHLLNTPDGVVDLRTGATTPHDPDQRLTKITRGCYRPGFERPDWTQTLTAVREDARVWFQQQMGWAITGYPSVVLLIWQGGGENGKTAIVAALLAALGDYASAASDKLLTSGEHSTERADLRGHRLLIAEELTDQHVLDLTAIKRVTDVSQIRARHLYRELESFTPSHSLVITTNSVPIVEETDHGTWRRLLLVTFPYTFRKPHDPILGPADRLGDPGLKGRLTDGTDEVHDAIVTWAVEGARLSYATHGVPPLPKSVATDTLAWQIRSDPLLGFWRDWLVVDTSGCVTTVDLGRAFNVWLREHGQTEWSQERFRPAFKRHAQTVRYGITTKRVREIKPWTLSRPTTHVRTLPPLSERPDLFIGLRFRAPDDERPDDDDPDPEDHPVADTPDPPPLADPPSASSVTAPLNGHLHPDPPLGHGGQGVPTLSLYARIEEVGAPPGHLGHEAVPAAAPAPVGSDPWSHLPHPPGSTEAAAKVATTLAQKHVKRRGHSRGHS
jgi:P4 family phage/plasmid primase-like protien